MSLQKKFLLLRRYNDAVRNSDPKLAEEIRDRGAGTEAYTEALPKAEHQIEIESIAMRRLRPVLAIKQNVTQLKFVDQADSEIWSSRLEKAASVLGTAIPAVGRVNLAGGQLDWVGTGWLVAEGIIVTNRHVAREFTVRNGDGLTFAMGLGDRVLASMDFLQEIDNSDALVFKLVKPLHIEEAPGPDLAFFEVEMVAGDNKLAKPIALAARIAESANVATIGYPAYDSRIPEPDLMERIYGKIYNKKRLAPGGVTRVEQTRIWHNCTTLGGNSGSVVFDLDSGSAIGLHFSGSFLATNYAVRADIVKTLLNNVRAGRSTRRSESPVRASAVSPSRGPADAEISRRPRFDTMSAVSIPLTLHITLSIEREGVGASLHSRALMSRAIFSVPEAEDYIEQTEGVVSDYSDRAGYDPQFLGKKIQVDLPNVTRDADDVLEYDLAGEQETELRYEHFSVVMSRSRRMCFLSACNIDGNQSKKSARVAWKWDPRIPKDRQIMKECYGNPPKFSRGHMTRREDPGWGPSTVAKRGNEDSMHVTNVTPQMQAFNAPIWLALEDYALQHAREDDMKISVFTGPYFAKRDPDMYGVKIPLAFWKVIAFIHDDTGKLCATGYEMNQEQSIQPEEEFVFGPFTSPQLGTAVQIPIRRIEARAGISFGKLVGLDPLADVEESVAGEFPPLLALEQIRFIH